MIGLAERVLRRLFALMFGEGWEMAFDRQALIDAANAVGDASDALRAARANKGSADAQLSVASAAVDQAAAAEEQAHLAFEAKVQALIEIAQGADDDPA